MFLFAYTPSYLVKISDKIVRIVCGDIGKSEFHGALGRISAVSMIAPCLYSAFVKHFYKLENILVGGKL